MVIISIGEWLFNHKAKVSARSAPRPFCSAKLSGLWRSLQETQLSEKGYASERILSQGKDWNDDLTEARQMQGGFEMKMA